MHIELAFKFATCLLPILANARAIVVPRETDLVPVFERDVGTDEVSNKTLLARATGDSASDPIDINFRCANTPDICEIDCFCILCYGAPDVLQRNSDQSLEGTHRSQSGDSAQPFRQNQQTMNRRGIDSLRSNAEVSPEEYPFASTTQGGVGACLAPVDQQQQSDQGTELSHALSAQGSAGVAVGNLKWYRIHFDGTGTYCTALRSKDTTVCGKKKAPDDWANYIYVRDSIKGKLVHFVIATTSTYASMRGKLIGSWP